MLKKLLRKLFKRQEKSREEHCYFPDQMVALNMPEVGQILMERFYELKQTCTPLVPRKERPIDYAALSKIIKRLD